MTPDTEQLFKLDKAHLIHALTPIGEAANVIIERGEGIWLYDVDGKPYLDARSQLNCVNIGYGHAGIIQAIKRQVGTPFPEE